MELETIWKNVRSDDDQLAQLLQTAGWEKLQSRLPLRKLKASLLVGLCWALLITGAYMFLILRFPVWEFQVALMIVSGFNLYIAWKTWQLFRMTNADVAASNNLKAELQKNYDAFQGWWRLQERISLFVYPVAVTGGFILGGWLGSGKPVVDFLFRTKVLLALGVCLVVCVPLCYYLARWMFNYAYGRHLKKLKATIAELEEITSAGK